MAELAASRMWPAHVGIKLMLRYFYALGCRSLTQFVFVFVPREQEFFPTFFYRFLVQFMDTKAAAAAIWPQRRPIGNHHFSHKRALVA